MHSRLVVDTIAMAYSAWDTYPRLTVKHGTDWTLDLHATILAVHLETEAGGRQRIEDRDALLFLCEQAMRCKVTLNSHAFGCA